MSQASAENDKILAPIIKNWFKLFSKTKKFGFWTIICWDFPDF
jgi:hypothetical protein